MNETAEAPIQGHEISNMGFLDLTSVKSSDALSGVTRIKNVGTILAPESLNEKLMSIPMENVGIVIPVPDGSRAKIHTGSIKMAGEALANTGGSKDDVLLVIGQLYLTTPVLIEEIGYKEIIVVGQVLAPDGSEARLGNAISRLTGHIVYYSGIPRIVNGEETYGKEFFEWLDKPITLVINGSLTLEEGVTAGLLREKITKILLNGSIRVPASLIPVIQVLTQEMNGEIIAHESDTSSPEENER